MDENVVLGMQNTVQNTFTRLFKEHWKKNVYVIPVMTEFQEDSDNKISLEFHQTSDGPFANGKRPFSSYTFNINSEKNYKLFYASMPMIKQIVQIWNSDDSECDGNNKNYTVDFNCQRSRQMCDQDGTNPMNTCDVPREKSSQGDAAEMLKETIDKCNQDDTEEMLEETFYPSSSPEF